MASKRDWETLAKALADSLYDEIGSSGLNQHDEKLFGQLSTYSAELDAEEEENRRSVREQSFNSDGSHLALLKFPSENVAKPKKRG